jgi:hypothetical protein
LFKLAKACGESCVPLMLLQERLDADTLHAAELLDGVRSWGPLACLLARLLLLPCCCLLVASVPDDCAFARVCMPEQCSPCAQSGSSRNRRKDTHARARARTCRTYAHSHTRSPPSCYPHAQAPKDFDVKARRLRTQMFYKQKKYNLMREDSEGCVLVSCATTTTHHFHSLPLTTTTLPLSPPPLRALSIH